MWESPIGVLLVGDFLLTGWLVVYYGVFPTCPNQRRTMKQSLETDAYALTAVLATTPAINVTNVRDGRIINNGNGGAITLSFHESTTEDGTYYACEDVSNLVIANNSSKAIPSGVAGSHFIKLVASTGTPNVIVVKSVY